MPPLKQHELGLLNLACDEQIEFLLSCELLLTHLVLLLQLLTLLHSLVVASLNLLLDCLLYVILNGRLLLVVGVLQLGWVVDELLLSMLLGGGIRSLLLLHLLPLTLELRRLLFELSVGSCLGLLLGHALLHEALLIGFELLLLRLGGLLLLRKLLLNLLWCLRRLATTSLLLLLLLLCSSPLLLLSSVRLASILVLRVRGHPLLILQHCGRYLLLRPSCLILWGRCILWLLTLHELNHVGVRLACHLLCSSTWCGSIRPLHIQNLLNSCLAIPAPSEFPQSRSNLESRSG